MTEDHPRREVPTYTETGPSKAVLPCQRQDTGPPTRAMDVLVLLRLLVLYDANRARATMEKTEFLGIFRKCPCDCFTNADIVWA